MASPSCTQSTTADVGSGTADRQASAICARHIDPRAMYVKAFMICYMPSFSRFSQSCLAHPRWCLSVLTAALSALYSALSL